jgi:hypothetical protein
MNPAGYQGPAEICCNFAISVSGLSENLIDALLVLPSSRLRGRKQYQIC